MSELVKRTLFGVLYVALVVACLRFFPDFVAPLFMLFSLLCVFEVVRLSDLKRLNMGWFVGLWLLTWTALYLPFPPELLAITIVLLYVVSMVLDRVTWRVLYVMQPFVLSVFAVKAGFFTSYDVVLMVFILIWLNDSGAYVFGRTFGKTLLAPKVSPKKTWEGFAGGILSAALIQLLVFPFIYDGYYWVYGFVAAVLVGSSATLGDLIQSRMKRKAGVKDSGKILPGHGGAFDRLDSFIFAMPVVLIFYTIIYL